MIAQLRGTLAHAGPGSVVVDVGGVGYLVTVSARHLEALPAVGQEVRLYTTMAVREDAIVLYGFSHPEERELFGLLIGVSGVGAKMAMGLLSALSVPDIVSAVVSGDVRRLATAPGVGKKTAERLGLELREKLAQWRPLLTERPRRAHRPDEEVEGALLALGYGEDEVDEALGAIGDGGEVEETLRRALAYLSRA